MNKKPLRLAIFSLLAISVAGMLSSAVNASYDGLTVFNNGNIKIYQFEFKDRTVKQMRSWYGAVDNAASIVNRILNDNFRNLGSVEKYIVMGVADAFIAYYLHGQAIKDYAPGRSMYVSLEVNQYIASKCVTISKVRQLWSNLFMNLKLARLSGLNVPWIALPCP